MKGFFECYRMYLCESVFNCSVLGFYNDLTPGFPFIGYNGNGTLRTVEFLRVRSNRVEVRTCNAISSCWFGQAYLSYCPS
jgi:hypothetical protein